MNRLRVLACGALSVACFAGSAAAALEEAPPESANPLQPLAPASVVVRFRAGSRVGDRSRAIQSVDALGQEPLALPRTHELALPPGESAADAAGELEGLPQVEWAEPTGRARLFAVPNDPGFTSLWGLRNSGQSILGVFGTPGVDIGATAAWDTTTGSRDVLVGVVDSGISATHPDLSANLRGDLGRNFVPPVSGGTVDAAAWDDQSGHGTHVAGTIGATGNNALGVAGVAWSAGLLPIRTFDMWGSAFNTWIADGLQYAAARTRVVNASFGSSSGTLMDAVIAANPQTLFVAAAGNSTADVDVTPEYPCAINRPNVLCVAALDSRGNLATFSNFGANSVDLAAPGVSVNSSYVPVAMVSDQSSSAALGAWDAVPASAWPEVTSTNGLPLRVTSGNLTAGAGGLPDGAVASLTLPSGLPTITGIGCRLDYQAAVRLPTATSSFAVQAKAPSGAWTTIPGAEYTGTTGGLIFPFSEPLDGYAGVNGLLVRFVVNGPSGNYGTASTRPYLAVGGIKVNCIGAQPAGGSYGYLDGTSMAAPHVAGAAALLLARRPDLTVAQLRDALLSTAAPMPSLAGKVATGGRLDLAAAMRKVAPAEAPAPPVSVPQVSPAPPAPPPVPMVLTLRGAQPVTVRVRSWTARLPLRCSGTAATRCVMAVSLRTRRALAPGRPVRWVTLGSTTVSVPPGWSGTRAVRIRPLARPLLAPRTRLAAEVRVVPRPGSAGAARSGRVRLVR